MSAGEGSSVRVVVAALAGNLLIAVSKFVAAFFSGSIATLAEAIHSVADCVNQVLLMIGMRRAERRPSNLHPFGHAAESYFWPFMVSVLIFLLGGVFAFYEGSRDLYEMAIGEHRESTGSRIWSYVVLGTSFALESYSFSVAFGEFKKMIGKRTVWQTLMHAKDPTIPVVLAEDSAALLGLAIALVAVGLTDLTGWHGCDAIGSIVIGILLGVIGFFLAARTHSLLLGEAASPEDREKVEHVAKTVDGVERVTQLLSMHIGPRAVILALKVRFVRELSMEKLESTIDALEEAIRKEMPHMRYIFVEPDSDYALERDEGRPVVTKKTAGF